MLPETGSSGVRTPAASPGGGRAVTSALRVRSQSALSPDFREGRSYSPWLQPGASIAGLPGDRLSTLGHGNCCFNCAPGVLGGEAGGKILGLISPILGPQLGDGWDVRVHYIHQVPEVASHPYTTPTQEVAWGLALGPDC
uniref:Uncharacterized protein n=1 Tax=Myotis myotis TaxID=51298 RepID=A0A7J8ANM3_MYOMY|nr:hypothetical protein mMyoMyo1_008145 [Myotis myotis]